MDDSQHSLCSQPDTRSGSASTTSAQGFHRSVGQRFGEPQVVEQRGGTRGRALGAAAHDLKAEDHISGFKG
jgi:hypothetical protein